MVWPIFETKDTEGKKIIFINFPLSNKTKWKFFQHFHENLLILSVSLKFFLRLNKFSNWWDSERLKGCDFPLILFLLNIFHSSAVSSSHSEGGARRSNRTGRMFHAAMLLLQHKLFNLWNGNSIYFNRFTINLFHPRPFHTPCLKLNEFTLKCIERNANQKWINCHFKAFRAPQYHPLHNEMGQSKHYLSLSGSTILLYYEGKRNEQLIARVLLMESQVLFIAVILLHSWNFLFLFILFSLQPPQLTQMQTSSVFYEICLINNYPFCCSSIPFWKIAMDRNNGNHFIRKWQIAE